jgi:hypothetical protein
VQAKADARYARLRRVPQVALFLLVSTGQDGFAKSGAGRKGQIHFRSAPALSYIYISVYDERARIQFEMQNLECLCLRHAQHSIGKG